eukprot:4265371-Pleurochrysis_carterae.AAC.3
MASAKSSRRCNARKCMKQARHISAWGMHGHWAFAWQRTIDSLEWSNKNILTLPTEPPARLRTQKYKSLVPSSPGI